MQQVETIRPGFLGSRRDLLGLAGMASAQGERGVIGGSVADAQGGVLPGVTVTVRNINTGFTQTAVTEGNGQYRFGALPPGTYELQAALPGVTAATATNTTPKKKTPRQQKRTRAIPAPPRK